MIRCRCQSEIYINIFFFMFSIVTANLSFIRLGHCYCRWAKVYLPMCWDKTYGRMSQLSHESNLSMTEKTEVHYVHTTNTMNIFDFVFTIEQCLVAFDTFIALKRYYFCQLQIKMSIWISHLHLCQKKIHLFFNRL